MNPVFDGIFKDGKKIYTLSLAPGKNVYDEQIMKDGKKEYRAWDPFRSKLSAAIHRGLKTMPIKPGSSVLYLGAAQGTTPSHVSDIVGNDGLVVCIEISAKPFEKLMELCEDRENLIPVLADANDPASYSEYVEEPMDVVYQDVAQRNQAEIAVKNCNAHLKKNGYLVLIIKARSIDVTKDPKLIFKDEVATLEKADLEIVETLRLDPFEKDHACVVARKIK